MSGELELLTQAERMLAQVATARDAVDLIDLAEAARVWAKRARLGTAAINHATSIKVKAEIRLADVVDEGQAAGTIAERGKRPSPDKVRAPDLIRPPTLPELGTSKQRVDEARKIRDWYTPASVDALVAEATAEDREVTRVEFVRRQGALGKVTGTAEWYTPPRYLASARAVMGSIDVDPASNEIAQATVQAGTYYTVEDSGLAHDWPGTVWMNPPYAGRWQWDAYGYTATLPRGISPGDIDAYLEVGGRFLFIENKQYQPDDGRVPYYLPKGQELALTRLARQPDTTVLYIAGDADDCSPWWLKNLTTGQIADLRTYPDPGYRRAVLARFIELWAGQP